MHPIVSKSLSVVWLLLFFAVAIFIRVHGADNYYFNSDEAMHFGIASGNSLKQVLQFSRYETHPPLFYILCHYWMLFSHDIAWVRSLSLVFGLATIVVFYRIGTLINGRLCGIFCALITAFSSGCIIQSYLIRQYATFLLFASLAFYFYLLWRNGYKTRWLLAYTLCITLACLTHFSAAFFIICTAAHGMYFVLREQKSLPIQLGWIASNILGICVIAVLLWLWQPAFTAQVYNVFTLDHLSQQEIYRYSLLYPLVISSYLFFGKTTSLLPWIIGAIALLIPGLPARTNKNLQSLVVLMCGAILLGMLLFICRFYTLEMRHSMWTFPFVIPVMGWLAADTYIFVTNKFLDIPLLQRSPFIALIAVAAGYSFYNPQTRFADEKEYALPLASWNDLDNFLSALGPKDMVVMERDDAIILTNLYPLLGNTAFEPTQMITIAPYHNTHILFNPYYRRYWNMDIPVQTIQEAQTNHLLDGIEDLVFVKLQWPNSHLTHLMLCKNLDKQVVTFPDATTQNDVTAMRISKDTFINDMLSPNGRAHACLHETP